MLQKYHAFLLSFAAARRCFRTVNEAEPDQTAHVQGLFVQNLPALRGMVLGLVGDFSLVDDVVQETFLTVTQKAATFERGTNFRAWAAQIARYKTLQLLEKAKPVPERFTAEVINALCAHDSAQQSYNEEQLGHLDYCLKNLAPRARAAVELRYQQAHRPPEIARRLNCTVDSINVSLSRARLFLRDCVTQRMAGASAAA